MAARERAGCSPMPHAKSNEGIPEATLSETTGNNPETTWNRGLKAVLSQIQRASYKKKTRTLDR